MRISVHNQAKNFILKSKETQKFVYNSKEIKLSLKNYLVSQWLLYSPLRGVFILKTSKQSSQDAVKQHIYAILEKLGYIISWDFALFYHLNIKKIPNEIICISKDKNFTTYVWESLKYKLICRKSTVPRLTQQIEINSANLTIESALSFVINYFYHYKDDKNFHKLILSLDFDSPDLVNLLVNKYKIRWISRLAMFYKNHWFPGKYSLIQSVLKDFWKKLDRRDNKVNITQDYIPKNIQKNELEDLLNA